MPTPKTAIPMAPTSSSQIHAFGYEPTTATLAVQFHAKEVSSDGQKQPGPIYHYANVPLQKYKDFTSAPSKYGFFHRNIKGKHTFSKVG